MSRWPGSHPGRQCPQDSVRSRRRCRIQYPTAARKFLGSQGASESAGAAGRSGGPHWGQSEINRERDILGHLVALPASATSMNDKEAFGEGEVKQWHIRLNLNCCYNVSVKTMQQLKDKAFWNRGTTEPLRIFQTAPVIGPTANRKCLGGTLLCH